MKLLNQLLQPTKKSSSWLGYIALFLGVMILFLSVQFYLDARQLLFNPSQQQDGFTYLVVNKKITNAMMGNNSNSAFSSEEIKDFQTQQGIEQVGSITSNRFSITANTLGQLAFTTELFFESVPDEYLDVKPDHWQWKKGDQVLPILISSDYLNLYNFGFALSQGLPQMSEETIKAIPFNITIYNSTSKEEFVANVVGFTQRYSSVLVPQEFMNYANSTYGQDKPEVTSRVILKSKEPDNPSFVRFLEQHQYATQNDKLKSSKLKSIVNVIFGACGLMGIFVFLLSIIILFQYINVVILQSKSNLQLLHILGYKMKVLQTQFTKQLIQKFALIVFIALMLTQGIHLILSKLLHPYQVHIAMPLSWILIVIAVAIVLLPSYWMKQNVRKILEGVIANPA